ncbi:unnamed protein product [Ostreobium quekettii]|uniref:Uncharacterized protein n=1 Tax=Ostreobium quekettii TaxID=121088 RepID=A0A8S1ISQ8_9CHLO|nr:unnamed protein product [Ostreobium quekettii]
MASSSGSSSGEHGELPGRYPRVVQCSARATAPQAPRPSALPRRANPNLLAVRAVLGKAPAAETTSDSSTSSDDSPTSQGGPRRVAACKESTEPRQAPQAAPEKFWPRSGLRHGAMRGGSPLHVAAVTRLFRREFGSKAPKTLSWGGENQTSQRRGRAPPSEASEDYATWSAQGGDAGSAERALLATFNEASSKVPVHGEDVGLE